MLFPLVFIALRECQLRTSRSLSLPYAEYVNQGHRFDIYEDVGCYPFIYNTIVAFLLSDCWPIIIGLVSAVYCGTPSISAVLESTDIRVGLSLHAFYRRRVQFNQFLSSNTSLSASRYFRLMALSMTELCCTLPLSCFLIWINSSATPVSPWISWENTHYGFSRVGQYPSVVWTQDYLFVVAVQMTRWMTVACAFIFFAFFGFASEARKNYGIAFYTVAKVLGVRPAQTQHSSRYAVIFFEFLIPTGPSCYRSDLSPRRPVMMSQSALPIYVVKEHERFSCSDSDIKISDEKDASFCPELTPSDISFPELPFESTESTGIAV